MIFREKYYLVILFLFTVFGTLGLINLSLRPKLPLQIKTLKDGLQIQGPIAKLPPEIINHYIISIENWPIKNSAQLDVIVEMKEIGNVISMKLDDGKIYQFHLVRRFNSLYFLLFAFLGICFFVIAGLVWHGSRNQGEKYFAISGALLGYILMMTWAGMKLPLYISVLLILIYFLSYPQAFLTFLFFCYHFPSVTLSQRILDTQKRILQITGISFSILLLILFFRQYLNFNLDSFNQYHWGYRVFRIFIFFNLTFSVVLLIRNLKKAPNPANRRKMLWVVWGVIWGSFPFVFLWNLPQIFNYQPLIPEWVFLIFVLLTPASIAIAILRYRLFDIEIVVSRSLVYSLVLLCLIAFYIFFIGTVSFTFFRQFSLHRSPVLSIISAVLIGLLFNPVKSGVQGFVDKKFFRIRYDRFKSLQNFLQNLDQLTYKSDIIQNLLSHYQAVVPVLNYCFVYREISGWNDMGSQTRESQNLINWMTKQINNPESKPIFNDNFSDRIEPDLGLTRLSLPDEWVLLIPVGDNAFWALGQKLAKTKFWKEDIDLAIQMAKAACLQLEKLNYVEISLKASLEKEQAEKLSEWKTILVSQVAHDLRAPLNTMLWKLKNLQQEIDQVSVISDQQFLAGMQKQIFRLQKMIQSLLTISHIEHGTLNLRKESINLHSCFSMILDNLVEITSEKKLNVVLECDESLCIRTDAVLFEEIILNLLHNAFKYSLPEKNIQILCKQSNTDSTKEAIIKIKDEAGGIPEDILKEASQAFSPGKSTRDLKEGFHLGLYIIHEFTKILDGEIIFNPVNNTGTEAILSFKENLT